MSIYYPVREWQGIVWLQSILSWSLACVWAVTKAVEGGRIIPSHINVVYESREIGDVTFQTDQMVPHETRAKGRLEGDRLYALSGIGRAIEKLIQVFYCLELTAWVWTCWRIFDFTHYKEGARDRVSVQGVGDCMHVILGYPLVEVIRPNSWWNWPTWISFLFLVSRLNPTLWYSRLNGSGIWMGSIAILRYLSYGLKLRSGCRAVPVPLPIRLVLHRCILRSIAIFFLFFFFLHSPFTLFLLPVVLRCLEVVTRTRQWRAEGHIVCMTIHGGGRPDRSLSYSHLPPTHRSRDPAMLNLSWGYPYSIQPFVGHGLPLGQLYRATVGYHSPLMLNMRWTAPTRKELALYPFVIRTFYDIPLPQRDYGDRAVDSSCALCQETLPSHACRSCWIFFSSSTVLMTPLMNLPRFR